MSEHRPFDFGMPDLDGVHMARVCCKACHEVWPCLPSQLTAERAAREAAEARVAALTAELDTIRRCWQTTLKDGQRNLEMRQYWHRRALDAESAVDDYVDRFGFDENGDPRPSFESLRALLTPGEPAAMVRCPDCLQTATTADEIEHGDGCEAAYCAEDRHIILPSGQACVCGDNRTELLL